MKIIILFFVFTLEICAIGFGAQQNSETVEWMRDPELTIPFLKRPPLIDGNLSQEEWQEAAELGPLKSDITGVADEYRRRVFVAYDQENIYIAFDVERPTEMPLPKVPIETGRVDSWRDGDSFEFYINTDFSQEQNAMAFILYANGAFGEGLASPGVSSRWNTEWRQAARTTTRGWQGEVAIPFASLGEKLAPAPGTVWGMDFISCQRTPSAVISHWGFRRNWHAFQHFGKVTFGAPEDPAIRFTRAEGDGVDNAIVEFELVNGSPKPASVQAEVRVMRRKSGPEGGQLSFFQHVESGGESDAKAQADYQMTTTTEGLIRDALSRYTLLPGTPVESDLEVPSQQRVPLLIHQRVEPGEFLVVYHFRNRSDGRILAQGAVPFVVPSPLEIEVKPYWLKSKILEVFADFKRIRIDGDATIEFSIKDLTSESESKILKRFPVPAGSHSFKETLDVRDLSPGSYQLSTRIIDAAGKAIGERTVSLVRPENPEWHDNSLGLNVKVPPPWTPIKLDGRGVFEVWGRRYDISNGWPTSIVSQGKEILAEPVRLVTVVDEKEVTWKLAEFESGTADESVARWAVRFTSSAGEIRGKIFAEFDGFLWYDLEFIPAKDGQSLDRLVLTYALPKKLVELGLEKFQTVNSDGGKTLLARGFHPYLWLGNENAGLSWISEGPAQWRNSREDEAIQVRSGGNDTLEISIEMVNESFAMQRPFPLRFGFQASPIRAFPNMKTTYVSQSGAVPDDEQYWKDLKAAGVTTYVAHSGWRGDRNSEWSGWPELPSSEERREQIRNSIRLAHKHGIRVLLYTGWGVEMASQEYQNFGNEMLRMPVESAGFGTYRQSAGVAGGYNDLMAHKITRLIEEFDIDGVFFDSTSNITEERRWCTNQGIGNGWIDDDGKVHGTVPILAHRDLFKRIYTLFHGEKKDDGVVINFGGDIWAINTFADIYHRGEGEPMHVSKLIDAWKPLSEYRTNYSARPFGLRFLAMNKNFKRLPMTTNLHHAVTLLHGDHTKMAGSGDQAGSYDPIAQVQPAIIRAKEWLPFDDKTQAFLYYENSDKVRLESEDVLSSVFVNKEKGRALIVVSNLHDKPVQGVEIHLNLEALGFGGGKNLVLEDAFLGEIVPVNGGSFKLDVQPEGYRLLKAFRR